jgi:hypothetical protein
MRIEDSTDFRKALSIVAWGEAEELDLRLQTSDGQRQAVLPLSQE